MTVDEMLQPLRDAAKLAGNPLLGFSYVGPSGSVAADYVQGESSVYPSLAELIEKETERISLDYAASQLPLHHAGCTVFVHKGDYTTIKPFLLACLRHAVYSKVCCWAIHLSPSFARSGHVAKLISPTDKFEDL